MNGYSEVLEYVFGPAGVGARSAVGMGSLPFRTSVEIEVILEIIPDSHASSAEGFSSEFKYEDLGVASMVNAMGTMTSLGGSRMSAEVVAAMNAASRHFVNMNALLSSAGAEISRLCRAPEG